MAVALAFRSSDMHKKSLGGLSTGTIYIYGPQAKQALYNQLIIFTASVDPSPEHIYCVKQRNI